MGGLRLDMNGTRLDGTVQRRLERLRTDIGSVRPLSKIAPHSTDCVVNLTVQLKPEQISRIIRSQIKYYQNAIEQSETGTVTMVGDGIARAAGLDNCMAGELVQFESGAYGMAQNLEENSVSIVLLGDDSGIKEGSSIHRTGKVVSVPVGEG